MRRECGGNTSYVSLKSPLGVTTTLWSLRWRIKDAGKGVCDQTSRRRPFHEAPAAMPNRSRPGTIAPSIVP